LGIFDQSQFLRQLRELVTIAHNIAPLANSTGGGIAPENAKGQMPAPFAEVFPLGSRKVVVRP
jgi:hypothetical protein